MRAEGTEGHALAGNVNETPDRDEDTKGRGRELQHNETLERETESEPLADD